VQQDELRQFLTSFASDRVALIQRHEAAARVVSHYDFNNTYQYVIGREETHLTWLEKALLEVGEPLPTVALGAAVSFVSKPGKQVDAKTFRSVLEEDARGLDAFVRAWRERVEGMTHARHRIMLNVILGESLEHQRLFEQAASGFEDLLGRRTGGVPRQGQVLPNRWME
jgi:FAD/FMN-containing dehydrogenase